MPNPEKQMQPNIGALLTPGEKVGAQQSNWVSINNPTSLDRKSIYKYPAAEHSSPLRCTVGALHKVAS